MKNIRLSHRMMLIMVCVVVGFVALTAVMMSLIKGSLMEDRQEKTQNLVENAYSVIEHYAKLEQNGELSTADAQTAALTVIKSLRYGDDGYFWINDYQHKMVMHPMKPALDGTDLSKLKDKADSLFFVEMVDTVKASGHGFVSYYWPKPGSDEPVEKLSFVKGYQPWGWIVGTGIYIDDVDAIFMENLIEVLLISLVTLLVVSGACFFVARSIVKPLLGMTDAMGQLASGDLQVEVPARDQQSEIGHMARAVQVFKENAIDKKRLEAQQVENNERKAEEERKREMMALADKFEAEIKAVVDSLGFSSSQLQTTSQSMSATAEETSHQATTVAAASEEATTNVQTVASAAEQLSASISEISRQVSDSARIAHEAAEEADRTQSNVKGLAEAAEKIGAVVEMITDIAAQTNLLALNATIEAARAGEAGKGFAVVASEVKTLANQTAKATDEIAGQINGVRAEIDSTVGAIDGIVDTIGRINEIAASIASAVEEQGAATQEIARNVEQAAQGTQEVSSNISGVTQAAGETGQAATQVLGAAKELAEQSNNMKQYVETFLSDIRAA